MSDFLTRDLDTPDKLSIPKIQWVLKEVQEDFHNKFGKKDNENFKIDVLGLDSCLMSMAEIGYELRKYVRFMVGAEGYEPNAGWPYERVLSDLLTHPQMTPEELGCRIVDRYVAYYKDFLPAGRSVDQSVCDLSKCDKLATAIKLLADILINKIAEPNTMRQVVLAHWEAQSYKDDQYVDLYDFCDLLDRSSSENPGGSVVMRGMDVDGHIREACQQIKNILKGNSLNGHPQPMVRHSCYSGPAVQYSYGLSMYFPWSKVIESYKDLEFANYTNWNAFLHRYVEKTRRNVRTCPSAKPQELVPACRSAEHQDLVPGQLFFNPVSAGFDFILTENKDAPSYSRVLSNKVGSMKNPPIDYVPCECPLKYKKDSTWQDPNGPKELE